VNGLLIRKQNNQDRCAWRLLTSLPVAGFERAATVVAWYAVRGCLEVYFHVLKSGCQIKQLHLETEERPRPCLALYRVIAWRVLYALMLGRACPDLDCEIVFDPREWRAAYAVVKRRPRRRRAWARSSRWWRAWAATSAASTTAPPAPRPCGAGCSACAILSSPWKPWGLLV